MLIWANPQYQHIRGLFETLRGQRRVGRRNNRYALTPTPRATSSQATHGNGAAQAESASDVQSSASAAALTRRVTPRPASKSARCRPRMGVSCNQRCRRGELRRKQAEARSKNGVVGSSGRNTPRTARATASTPIRLSRSFTMASRALVRRIL